MSSSARIALPWRRATADGRRRWPGRLAGWIAAGVPGGEIGKLGALAVSAAIHAVFVLTITAGLQSLGPPQALSTVAWMSLEAPPTPPPTAAPPRAELKPRDPAPRTPRRETIRPEPIALPPAAVPSRTTPDVSTLTPGLPEPNPDFVVSGPPGALMPMAEPEPADAAPATSRPAARRDVESAHGSSPSRSSEPPAPDGTATASLRPPGSPAGVLTRAAQVRGGYQVRPPYPPTARQHGIQGVTLLRVHVEADGRVGVIAVHQSAGHHDLDRAAADAVRQWRFEPARNDAGPVAMWVLIPVEFRLTDGQ